MNGWSALALVVAACGPGLASQPPTAQPSPLVGADAKQIRALLRDSVTDGGLWFADPSCVAAFPAPGTITGPKLDTFAACLAALHLQATDRRDALPDVSVLTYAPGFEIEARVIESVDGPQLSWIGFEARRDLADGLPTITPAALESLRTAGQRDGAPDHAEALDDHPATAWIKICVDESGAVTRADVRRATSPKTARAFAAMVKTWQFAPFKPTTQAMPVCAMELLAYPHQQAPADPALPLVLPDVATQIFVSELERTRVRGTKNVVPDDLDKTRLGRSQQGVRGSFAYCIDTSGNVSDVWVIQSSRLPTYDQKIIRTLRTTWAFKPYIDEGSAIPVCTAVTFIYSQR